VHYDAYELCGRWGQAARSEFAGPGTTDRVGVGSRSLLGLGSILKIGAERMPGFAAEIGLSAPGWIHFAPLPRVGPKDSGDVLPYVKIVEYDSRWPMVYAVERERILSLIHI